MAVAYAHEQFRCLLEEFRAMAHDALDKWVDGFSPFFEAENTPAIEKLFPHLLEQMQADCPRSKKNLCRKRVDERKISTMQGKFSIWQGRLSFAFAQGLFHGCGSGKIPPIR